MHFPFQRKSSNFFLGSYESLIKPHLISPRSMGEFHQIHSKYVSKIMNSRLNGQVPKKILMIK